MRGSVRIHPNTCSCKRCKKKECVFGFAAFLE